MVDVHYIITRLKRHDFFNRERLFAFLKTFLQSEAMVTFENLMIGVDEYLVLFVDESFGKLNG